MVFGSGELAFTQTSESQDESHTMALPFWGFGGGLRATVSASERVAFFAQGEIGALVADAPHNSLTVLGFRRAESLDASFGGRLGIDWYQADRHLAFCAVAGMRVAQGFAKVTVQDLPLMWDAGLGLRYAF
jgi:hypothetical protein